MKILKIITVLSIYLFFILIGTFIISNIYSETPNTLNIRLAKSLIFTIVYIFLPIFTIDYLIKYINKELKEKKENLIKKSKKDGAIKLFNLLEKDKEYKKFFLSKRKIYNDLGEEIGFGYQDIVIINIIENEL